MKTYVLKEVLLRHQICARRDEGTCGGRLTYEHAFGRKQEEPWQIVILCWQHHLVDLKKQLNRHLAYQQATDEQLRKYPKSYAGWKQEKDYLEKLYANNPSPTT